MESVDESQAVPPTIDNHHEEGRGAANNLWDTDEIRRRQLVEPGAIVWTRKAADHAIAISVAEMTAMMAGIAARDGGVPSQGSAPPQEIRPMITAQA